MCTLDQSLAGGYAIGRITRDVALERARDIADLKALKDRVDQEKQP